MGVHEKYMDSTAGVQAVYIRLGGGHGCLPKGGDYARVRGYVTILGIRDYVNATYRPYLVFNYIIIILYILYLYTLIIYHTPLYTWGY